MIKQVPKWSPINQKFYESDSDDDEAQKQNAKEDDNPHLESDDDDVEPNEEPIPEYEDDQSDELNNIENDLQWDSSPEQLALMNDNLDDTILDNALQPRQLFENDEVEETDDEIQYDEEELTSDTDDEEVFERDEFHTPQANPKLKRANAFRRKRTQKSHSEPRVTRQMLNSGNFRVSVSNPSSPSDVALSRRQNLNRVLNPRIPLVPEAVNLGPGAQLLHHALPPAQTPRRSVRNSSKAKVDYRELNSKGKKH